MSREQKMVAIAGSEKVTQLSEQVIEALTKIIEGDFQVIIRDEPGACQLVLDYLSELGHEDFTICADDTLLEMAEQADFGLVIREHCPWNQTTAELKAFEREMGRRARVIDGSPTCTNGDRILIDHIYQVQDVGEFLVIVPEAELIEGVIVGDEVIDYELITVPRRYFVSEIRFGKPT